MNRIGSRTMVPLVLVLVAIGPNMQADAPASRPRIGLVLSGGAALGSAHVGVIKVLEELRIPIDFVAGTSMGAIVGGLYASGVSPKEMETILAETDWRNLLDDRPPRRHLPYRKKVDDQTFLTRFEVGFNRRSLQIPPGLISGQKLGFALQLMVLRSAGIVDFDRLPIPFRAVATDLETGEMVVLRSGDLGRAMRASMSLPGIFSPIELDGRLLVDGGLARNLPVDVAREMGADVIIAVDVGQPLPEKDALTSLAKVAGQVVGLQIINNVKEQASEADVLIEPDLEGFGSAQFERGLEMVPIGEAAARALTADLEQYSTSDDEYQGRVRQIRRPRSIAGAKVRSIQLTQSSTADPVFVLGQIETRPGDAIDFEVIREDLERLFETGDYERVDVHLVQVEEDFDLYFEAVDKSWGPNYLRFGLNMFADFEGESSFDALASYTMTRLNRRRGELKLQVQLGENPAIVGEFHQPLSRGQTWFTALTLRQSTSTQLVPVGGGIAVPYRIDTIDGALDLGLQLGRYAELRLGLGRGSYATKARVDVSTGPFSFPLETESDLGDLHLTAVVDQFDNMNFPRHGYFVLTDYRTYRKSLGAETDYEHLVGFLGLAKSRGRHSLLGLSNFVSALSTESPEIYNLGGLFKLSGYPIDGITGQYGGNLTLLYLYRLRDLPLGIGNGLYIGGSIEGGNLWADPSDVSLSDLHYSGSLSIGADTILGPVYLAMGISEEGDQVFYLFIGRSF